MAIEERRGHMARKLAGCVKAAEVSVITPSQTADLIPILWLRPSLLDIRFQTNQRAPELLSMAAAQLHRKVLILLGNRLEDLQGCCDRVDMAAELYHPSAIRFENVPALVCRDNA